MGWETIVVCLIVVGALYLLVAFTEARPGRPLAVTRYYWLNVALGVLIVPVVALLGYALVGVAGFAVLAPVALGLDFLIELGLGWVVLVGLGVFALWGAYSFGKQVGQRQAVREPEIDPEVALRVYMAALAEPRHEHLDVANAKRELRARRRLKRAEALVHAYSSVLQAVSGVAVDEGRLPAPKDDIKAAICLWLSVEQDPQTIDLLRTVYVRLAMFQPGVGEAQLSLNAFLKARPPHDQDAFERARLSLNAFLQSQPGHDPEALECAEAALNAFMEAHPNQEALERAHAGDLAEAVLPLLKERQRWDAVVAQEERQLMAELERAGFGPS
jgi:hypothetical protein